MKLKQVFSIGIELVLVILLVTACVAPKAEPCPTTAPLSCPTTVTQPNPLINTWRWGGDSSNVNVVITFNPGDQCSMEIINPIEGPAMRYEIVTNDQTYQNYVIWTLTLDPGKTIEDLKAAPQSPYNPPRFVSVVNGNVVSSMSRSWIFSLPDMTKGPFYFICMVQGPQDIKIIDHLGPVEVP
jgi:hypothetical protein